MIMATAESLSRFEQLFWRPTGIMRVFGPEYKPTRLGWFTAVPMITLLAVVLIGVGVPANLLCGYGWNGVGGFGAWRKVKAEAEGD